jgi:hypothetical protein
VIETDVVSKEYGGCVLISYRAAPLRVEADVEVNRFLDDVLALYGAAPAGWKRSADATGFCWPYTPPPAVTTVPSPIVVNVWP